MTVGAQAEAIATVFAGRRAFLPSAGSPRQLSERFPTVSFLALWGGIHDAQRVAVLAGRVTDKVMSAEGKEKPDRHSPATGAAGGPDGSQRVKRRYCLGRR